MALTFEQCARHAEEMRLEIVQDHGTYFLYFAERRRALPYPFHESRSLIALCANLVAVDLLYGHTA